MTEVEDINVVQKIVNAWDCCGTCAGGVLARHVREAERRGAARELRKAGDALGHLWDVGVLTDPETWLRDRAERIGQGDT